MMQFGGAQLVTEISSGNRFTYGKYFMSLFMSIFFFGLGIIHLVRSQNFLKNCCFFPRENVCVCIRGNSDNKF